PAAALPLARRRGVAAQDRGERREPALHGGVAGVGRGLRRGLLRLGGLLLDRVGLLRVEERVVRLRDRGRVEERVVALRRGLGVLGVLRGGLGGLVLLEQVGPEAPLLAPADGGRQSEEAGARHRRAALAATAVRPPAGRGLRGEEPPLDEFERRL